MMERKITSESQPEKTGQNQLSPVPHIGQPLSGTHANPNQKYLYEEPSSTGKRGNSTYNVPNDHPVPAISNGIRGPSVLAHEKAQAPPPEEQPDSPPKPRPRKHVPASVQRADPKSVAAGENNEPVPDARAVNPKYEISDGVQHPKIPEKPLPPKPLSNIPDKPLPQLPPQSPNIPDIRLSQHTPQLLNIPTQPMPQFPPKNSNIPDKPIPLLLPQHSNIPDKPLPQLPVQQPNIPNKSSQQLTPGSEASKENRIGSPGATNYTGKANAQPPFQAYASNFCNDSTPELRLSKANSIEHENRPIKSSGDVSKIDTLQEHRNSINSTKGAREEAAPAPDAQVGSSKRSESSVKKGGTTTATQGQTTTGQEVLEEPSANKSDISDDKKKKDKSKSAKEKKKEKEKQKADAAAAAQAAKLRSELDTLPQRADARFIGSRRLPPRQSGEVLELCRNVVRQMITGLRNVDNFPAVHIEVNENAFNAIQTSSGKSSKHDSKKQHPVNNAMGPEASNVQDVSRVFTLDQISFWNNDTEQKRMFILISMESAATRHSTSDVHVYCMDSEFTARRICYAIGVAFRKRFPPQQSKSPNAHQPVFLHSSATEFEGGDWTPSGYSAQPEDGAAGGGQVPPRNQMNAENPILLVNPLFTHNEGEALFRGPQPPAGAGNEKSPVPPQSSNSSSTPANYH